MGKVKDLTGQKFGRLTVVKQSGFGDKNKHGSRYAKWLCKCDCGNYCERTTNILKRSRNDHSCGCLAKEHLDNMAKANVTHGMTGSRLYGCYKGMMSRCYRPKDIHYNAYGKRGITVCKEWKNKPKAFIEWALANGYSDDLTIERIDVNGNYEPSNCTWVPMSEQYKNKQSNCNKMPLPEPYKGGGNRMKPSTYYQGNGHSKYGIYNKQKKEFQFGICEDTPMLAEARLFQKIGEDAKKWKFEVRGDNMKYIAIFDLPDGYKMGCAAGKMIKPDGRKTYEEEEFEDVYAQIEPLSEQKAEVFERYNAVTRIMQDLGLANAYDMPSFWCNNRKDYKVIQTKYHQGYMKALEDVENEVRKRFGFSERSNVIDMMPSIFKGVTT